jgi:predicted amidohydrolase YtcJ
MPSGSSLLVHGGTILTQDPARPVAQALLVDDGAVAALGADDEVASRARPDAERLDLDGRVVCPGFIDAHNHFVFSILAELGIDCRSTRVRSVEEVLYELRQAVERTPRGQWVRGWGYNELDLGGRHPTLAELDRIAPDNPLVIGHASGHMCVANTFALGAAGITESTGDPPNGFIGRRRSGRLTGLLQEHASEMVDVKARSAIIAADHAKCLEAGRTVARRYASLGLTSICDPCVPSEVEPLYDELLGDLGFPIRIIGLGMGAEGLFAPPSDRLDEGREGAGNGFRISGVKFFADGGEQCAVCMSKRDAVYTALRTLRNAIRHRTLMGARLLSAPVTRLGRDLKFHSGLKFYDDRELAGLLQQTIGHGLAAAVHAMGNEAIDQVLDGVAEARRGCGDDAVFRMEHAMMPSEASLSRMAGLGVAAVVQPRFVHAFGRPLLLTGTNHAFRVLAFRDLMDQGVLLAGSSDAPVCDPAVLPAIESAVTRQTEHGEVLDRDQALSVDEALAMYTVGAAHVLGLGGTHGSLQPGRAADFVVLDRDPRAVDPQEIGRIAVELTYRSGRCVYIRDPPVGWLT